MITRRALFLGGAAIITTPGLLMPVRKLALSQGGLVVPGWVMAALEDVWLKAKPPPILVVPQSWAPDLMKAARNVGKTELVNDYIGQAFGFSIYRS